MIVTAWIMFVFFGLISLIVWIGIFAGWTKVNFISFTLLHLITAICAGIIWGGLFQ